MTWYTVQHKTPNNTKRNNEVTKLHRETLIHQERERAPGSLPARDHCGGSDPRRGGGDGEFWRAPSPPARWRTSAEKPGVAPSTIPPFRAARRRGGRGRETRGRRPTALYRGGGESLPTRVRYGFPGIASTTTASAAPSDSAVLSLPNACTTCLRHPTLVRWPPIRRHGRDPRRRKLSAHPAAAEAASWLLSTAVP